MSDEQEQSLITDEVRARIGQRTEPRPAVIAAKDVYRMRDLLEDDDPRYADSTGVSPPYALAAVHSGQIRGAPAIRVLPNGLLTQIEWQFERPFRVDEKLLATHYILDVRERLGGRYGHSVLVTTATDFADSEGNLVARSMTTVTQFDASKRRED